MRTLTLKIKDDYFDRLVSFLELLPKKAVKIERDDKLQLDSLKEQISEAVADIKAGRSSVLRVVD
mgnify:FL=1|jgi:hypothetical protein